LCAFVLLSFFFSSRRRHTRWPRDWSSDVCSSDLRSAAMSTRRTSVRYSSNMVGLRRQRRDPGRPSRQPEQPPFHLREDALAVPRSEERRVGKEWRSRWSANDLKKNAVNSVRRLEE